MALFIRYKRVESFKKKDIYTVVISNQNKFMNACIRHKIYNMISHIINVA